MSAPGRKKRKVKRPAKAKPLPPKSQISLPCQFAHVTQVLIEDTERYYSLQAFVKSPSPHDQHREDEEEEQEVAAIEE